LKTTPSVLLDFVVVKVVPVICDAAAAGRALQTSRLCPELDGPAFPVADDPPAPVLAAPAPVLASVLAALAGGAAEAGPDPPEHAVADAVTRIRLAAAKIVGTRMSSPVGLSLMSRSRQASACCRR
jgi:hypothetical protein